MYFNTINTLAKERSRQHCLRIRSWEIVCNEFTLQTNEHTTAIVHCAGESNHFRQSLANENERSQTLFWFCLMVVRGKMAISRKRSVQSNSTFCTTIWSWRPWWYKILGASTGSAAVKRMSHYQIYVTDLSDEVIVNISVFRSHTMIYLTNFIQRKMSLS